MMMKRWMIGLLAVLLLATAACSAAAPVEEEEATTTTSHVPLQLLDVTLTELLPQEKLTSLLGTDMSEPTLAENGTLLFSLSADQSLTVTVQVDKKDREAFDLVVSQYPQVEQAPNLGEVAWWFEAGDDLLVYANGYMMEIAVACRQMSSDELLLKSRAIAAALIEVL